MMAEKKFLTSDKPGKGLVWQDQDGKLAKAFHESQENEERMRKERLAIPEEAKPGSADMAFYTMRNTIIINQETADKAKMNHAPDRRLEALIDEQQKQQNLLRSIMKQENMTALEAYEAVQKKIDIYERMLTENENSVTDDDMRTAKLLQKRLLDEASKDNKK